MEERPPIWRIVHSRQGVVLERGDWAMCSQLLTVKTGFIANHEHLPRICIDTLVRGIWGYGLGRAGSG